MAIKAYKPTTSARRGMTSEDTSELTSSKPARSLTGSFKQNHGRNNQGRITTRHKGGGSRRMYRQISFSLPANYSGTVEHIEYDPNRTSHIARLKGDDGSYRYILAAQGIKVGQKIKSGDDVSIDAGNRLPIRQIPVGSVIHAIELKPGKGAQVVRSAGASAQLVARDDKSAQVKLPSGEVRLFSVECTASLGVIGNEQHQNVSIGKAGRNRRKGIRPSVRGVVMNAVDHPHGGGDGGRHRMAKAPRTPWGQKTLGLKTRSNKSTNKYIVRSRHASKRS
ncbi:MAG: 50S ribosomal protein L2 [Candidatus Saccharimonadales bacterium]